MLDRRSFLGASALAPALLPGLLQEIAKSGDDESYWQLVQQAFPIDRSWTNLNHGGVSGAPAAAHDAMKRHLDHANTGPARVLWQLQEPNREVVRRGLARHFGADPEEIAIVRNSSEGLEICQLGLDLQRGDEILANNQDYPRMLTTFQQREQREGLVLRTFPLPVPLEDPAAVVKLYEQSLTEKTKLILVSHVINLTGTILPVKEICALGRKRNIPVIVDGAHAFAHFPFKRDDLDCDYYATSLHKWLFAPVGTGMLYVKRDKIPALWPLMAAAETQKADIRKFEETGTRPAANMLAISESLALHDAVGAERKIARLRQLRDRWALRLAKLDKVKLLTNLKAGMSGAVATFAVEGVEPAALAAHLWEQHKIFVVGIGHPDVRGVRVSPALCTTMPEIDRFADAVEAAVKNGVKQP